MPHTSSAKKRLRQNTKRRLNNRAATKALKLQMKKVAEVAATGNVDELRKQYNIAAMKLDKAAAKNVVHKNLASRKKSQLARLINATAKTPPAPASK